MKLTGSTSILAVLVASALGLSLALCGCPPPAEKGAGASQGASGGSGEARAAESVSEGEYGATEDPEAVKVGAYFGLTGKDASFGQDSVKAMVLALDELNAEPGAPIKLIVLDDRCNPADIQNILNKLINADQVAAVIGEVASKLSLQGGPICQEAGVPMLSPSSTNPDVTAVGDCVFRTCFIDPYQGYVMARFALDNLDAKTAAILYPQDNDYSVGLARYFEEAFQEGGGAIVASEAYAAETKDFRAELDLIKAKNPDVLYAPCYYDDAGPIADQARALDMSMPILGGDGWDSPTVYAVGKDATNNCFFSNHYSKDNEAPIVQDFVKAYTARWGEAPSAMAATAYDGMKILAAAIRGAANPSDRAAVREALAAVADYEGVTGRITIDESRNARKDAVVLELKDGVQTYVTTIPAP